MASRGPELAIDSASNEAGIALLAGDRVLACRRWTVTSNYSLELLGGIDATLREAGVARDAISTIAVAIGPGGYGGLRSGVATAQGLALALDIPLAGVSRLEAAAFPHLGSPGGTRPVVAVHDPGGGRVAWAAYSAAAEAADAAAAAARGAGTPTPTLLAEPRIETIEECVRDAPRGALWCGELTAELVLAREAAQREAGEGRDGQPDEDVAPDANLRSPADLVRLARLHEAYGDPALVDVLYLRPPSITRTGSR